MTEQRKSSPRVPEQHLRAEISTFPLVTESAFRSAVVTLDPSLAGATGELWRACEGRIAEHTNWSLDRVVAIRDETWFGNERARMGERARPVAMHVYLRNLARSVLAPEPGLTRTIGEFEQSRLDAENRHHWMTFAMPEDLLLSGLRVAPTPERVVSDANLLVRRLLDSGVAEVHQHLGAGMSFPLLWASALATLALPDLREDLFEGPAAPLRDGQYLVRWLLAAAIARCVLGELLVRVSSGRAPASLSAFLAALLAGSTLSPRQRATLRACLLALESGADDALPDFRHMRDLYGELHPEAQDLESRPLRDVDDAFARCDPLALRVGLRGFHVGERWLQNEALAYLEGHDDRAFEVLWWQIVRVRCIYYRAIVERPQNTGLQWFIRFYNRIGKVRRALDPLLVEASFMTAGEGQPIAALEVRTSIENSPIAIAQAQLELLRAWTRVGERFDKLGRSPEFGLIYHFVKIRDTAGWGKGKPPAFWSGTHAEPIDGRARGVGGRERYLDFFLKQARTAVDLAEVIQRVPALLWLVRGIDTASDELGTASWIFAPIFAYLRQVSEIASRRPGGGPPLGLTVHVGEDFRHLLEGMRRVYEQVHYVLGPVGGRLGHAVALGVDPSLWAESSRTVVMPAEERLWDMVMEWRLHTQFRVPSEFATKPPPGRIEQLHNRLREVSEFVLGRAHDPQHLAEAHHALHRFLIPAPAERWSAIEESSNVLRRALERLDGHRLSFLSDVFEILDVYLNDEGVFRRGQTLIEVVTSDLELSALQEIQAGLRRGIGRRGIVVEVNPSSNLLIGDLVDLRNHPILRLSPPDRSGALPPVAIAIGSDDPVTFSTSLVREYVLLHQAARGAGFDERTVQTWLDDIRQTGMDARMTVAWRPGIRAQAMKIADDLSRYASLPRARSGLLV